MKRILQGPWRRGAQRVRRLLGGFTLLEVMISVAALAVLAVGIAAVFDVTGRTVTGGRRISALNAYANLLQQQMEADFAAMTRDGFLIIRKQYADADGDGIARVPTTSVPNITPALIDAVRLHADDTAPRPRRVDEIMFFLKGNFSTAREPLHPDLVAASDTARIYYGHGERARADLPGATYWRPELNDSNIHPGGGARLGYDVAGNPNRYASEWTLLRHVTLLVPRSDPLESRPPQNSRPALLATPLFPNPNANTFFALLDSEVQIAAQPAASSIFRALAARFPTVPQYSSATIPDPSGTTMLNPAFYAIRRGGNNNIRPQFSSGLVDIATIGLADIRAIVMTADTWPGGPPAGFPGNAALDNFFNPASNSGLDGTNAGLDRKYRRHGTGANQDQYLIQRTQAWMDDAFPTLSSGGTANQRRRIRYEPIPPNLIGASSGQGLAGGWPADLEAAFRRADQAMLASWGFLPRCSEFIVEWSFGQRFPSNPAATNYIPGRAGELVWHGLERMPDRTNLNLSVNNLPLAWPRDFPGPAAWAPYWSASAAASSLLIHGIDNWATQYNPAGPLTSFFGYVDPRHAGTLQNPTVPWPWPAFIRITMSLADPRDPSIEQTFQFVFSIPQQES
jgi:prepilin-type N-terminal cleavage/methylation domain-containing protein